MQRQSSFHELIKRDSSVTIHQQNLAVEIFKVMKGTAPTLVREVFSLDEENSYKLQNGTDFPI